MLRLQLSACQNGHGSILSVPVHLAVASATRLSNNCQCVHRKQIQSNALAALEAIDADMAGAIMEEGCVTGDRINGLCDGVTGDWSVP